MLLGGQTTEFHINAILPIASYSNGVCFPIRFAYQPKATPFAGEACETNHTMVPNFFGALRGRPLSNNANWQRLEAQGKPRVREKLVRLKPD